MRNSRRIDAAVDTRGRLAFLRPSCPLHPGHPDFRLGGRIFATMGYPDAGWAALKLTPDQQARWIDAEPDVFVPMKGAWGKQGCLVNLRAAKTAAVRRALTAAWRNLDDPPKKRRSAKK